MIPRLLIGAPHKSSGKTTVSLGLCAALADRGHRVAPFKKGPDYIDPMWLSRAAGKTCYNLDFNTMSHNEILATFSEQAANADIAVIEGNMGLYDSIDLEGTQSNAALAALLAAPVLLVVDAQGMTRSAAALIKGFADFIPKVRIAGIILNKLAGNRHEQRLREVIDHYIGIPVVGAINRDEELNIDERHLGLIPSNEARESERALAVIAARIAESVDLDAILDLAASAPALPTFTAPERTVANDTTPVRIGIAEDAAFGFYYASDRDRFRQLGAELVPFSPLNDNQLPAVDALFIGGGFPETHLAQLGSNNTMKAAVADAINAGMPAYAECGGLMYLSRSIRWQDQIQPMVGIVPADTVMYRRPQGKGYVRLTPNAHALWHARDDGATIYAHEFHYSTLENLDENICFAFDLLRGSGIDGRHDGFRHKNLIANYVHMHDGCANPWIERFVSFVRAHRSGATPTTE